MGYFFLYDWGNCQYHAGEGVGCYSDFGIAYQRAVSSTGGRRECKAKVNNKASNQVCKQETGRSAENGASSGWNYYFY